MVWAVEISRQILFFLSFHYYLYGIPKWLRGEVIDRQWHERDGPYSSNSMRPCARRCGGGVCMHNTLATIESGPGRTCKAEQASNVQAEKQRLASRETRPMSPQDPATLSGRRSLARSIAR